jgi:hypothetical protein
VVSQTEVEYIKNSIYFALLVPRQGYKQEINNFIGPATVSFFFVCVLNVVRYC